MNHIFTNHAKDRINKRNLTELEVIESIEHADKILTRQDKYYAQKLIREGKIEVVFEKGENYIKIITVYWI